MRRAIVLAAGLLAGCASTADLRQAAPASVQTVKGTYIEVADCLVDELRVNHGTGIHYDLSDRPRDHMAWISSQFFTLTGGSPAWEVALIQSGADVRVEVHSRYDVWGNPMYPDGDGKLLRKCAAA